jgi:hypothetical protein
LHVRRIDDPLQLQRRNQRRRRSLRDDRVAASDLGFQHKGKSAI